MGQFGDIKENARVIDKVSITALFAAERSEAVSMKLRNADIEHAINELVMFGGDLTQNREVCLG